MPVRRLLPVTAACCLAVVSAYAQPSGAVHCEHLVDVRSGHVVDDQLVVFAGGKVTQIGPSSSVKLDPGVKPLELPGLTCLPGLIDAHVHLTVDPSHAGYQGLGVSEPAQVVIGVRNARRTLQAGFTSVRNVGADGFTDVALRDGIANGDIDGPRMLVSGPPLGITGGHADENLLPWEYHHRAEGVADGPWAARAKVRENAKFGADLIKIMASGGVLSKGDQPGAEQYSLEEMQAIVTEAHMLGRKVAAHAHGAQAIHDAILAGVDSVEHASLITDDDIRLARQRGTYLVFDIYDDDYILQHGLEAGMLPESIEKEKGVGRIQRENFRKAHAAGSLLAFGTDAGVYPHGDNAKQFAKMVQWGMTPIEAIQAATLASAKLMGWQDKAGSLEPGHYADLIAVKGDPTQDVTVLEHVSFVMQGGAVKKPVTP